MDATALVVTNRCLHHLLCGVLAEVVLLNKHLTSTMGLAPSIGAEWTKTQTSSVRRGSSSAAIRVRQCPHIYTRRTTLLTHIDNNNLSQMSVRLGQLGDLCMGARRGRQTCPVWAEAGQLVVQDCARFSFPPHERQLTTINLALLLRCARLPTAKWHCPCSTPLSPSSSGTTSFRTGPRMTAEGVTEAFVRSPLICWR